METKDSAKYLEYTKIRNQVRNMTRERKRELEKEIEQNVKKNPKAFWAYVKTKTKTKSEIPDLKFTDTKGARRKTRNDEEKSRSVVSILLLSFHHRTI